MLRLLLLILIVFSYGSVCFHALASMGAAALGLGLQFVSAVLYLAFIYIVLHFTNGGLTWAWCGELFYWILILSVTIWYLRSERWHSLKV